MTPILPWRLAFLVFCFSEAGFLGNKTLALRQPVRESMSQLARGWRYYPKTMVLTFASLSIPNAACCIADRQNLKAVVLLLSFHLGAEHGTLTLFSPEIVPFQSDDWNVIRAMRACWLPPKLVSEMCCRWICGIPRILNGKYVFIALDDVDITPTATVKVHFGAFINLSLTSQVGRSIEIHSPLLTVSSESASTDPTFCNWQSGREHLAPPELAEDAFFWMRAGQLRPSHSSALTSARTSDETIGADLEIQAGGKRALRTQALPAFNFSTAVFVIGEEGHHGTLLLPGFASEEAIILQVAAKIRPRFTFVHPITETCPLPDELLFGDEVSGKGTRNCICLVSTRTVECAAFILFNSAPMHLGAPKPENKSLRGVWLPGTRVSLQQIQSACDIPITVQGNPTITFCNSEPIPDHGVTRVQTGSFIFYTASETSTDHTDSPTLQEPQRHTVTVSPRIRVAVSEYRSLLPSARFHFTHNFIYFPIGDAWHSVTANFWLYAMLLSLHFSCNGPPTLNADTVQSMLTPPEYCKLIACSHYFARFIRLRALKDAYWYFEFGRVYENAAGIPPVGFFHASYSPMEHCASQPVCVHRYAY